MRIKRLDISGFKSFCDPVRIAFNSSVTGVVGPNGCGKSNIVDALRWTLGEGSAKALRGSSMEDVIFSGSESRGPKSMAEVTITFDNTDGLSHASYLDFSDISVTRRLHRDGASEYLVNNVPCRRRDITDLFLGTGGGARAYSIVEQGRIGLIVSARAEDRRGMLEEAAGITKYKTARRTSERRMDQTRQNLLRVSDVVAEMSRNLASLNRQAKKAERFSRYKNERVDLELHVASHRYLKTRAETLAVRMALTEQETQLIEARTELAASETRIESLRVEEQSARASLDEETARVYEIDKQLQVAETEIRHLVESIDRHRREEASSVEQSTHAAGQKEQFKEERELIKSQLDRVAEDRESSAVRYVEIQEQVETARGQLQILGEEHDVKRDEVSRSKSLLAAAETASSTLGRRIEEIEARLESVCLERENMGKQSEDLLAKSKELLLRSQDVESRLFEARDTEQREREAFNILRVEVENLDQDLRQIRDDLQAKRSRKSSLEEVMDGLESHDSSVREAVTMLEEESLAELKGLLVDVIASEEQYEPAVAAAFGDRLQALMVKDRASGLRILQLLKERDMGRVAMAAADKLFDAGVDTAAIEDERCLGPILRHIRCDDSALSLVEHILKNIYLVSTLEEAESLFETHRGELSFVTLDGQLLEAGGVMRGGRVKTTGAQLLGQQRQIRDLSVEVTTLGARYDDLSMRYEAVKDELRARETASETARTMAQSEEISLAEVKKDRSRTDDDIEAIERRKAAMDRDIAHQNEMLTLAKRDVEQATSEATRLKQLIEETEQLLHARAGEIDGCRREVDRLSGMSADIRVNKAALDQQWESGRLRLKQLTQLAGELEERLAMSEDKRAQSFEALGRAAGSVFLKREHLAIRLEESEAARQKTELLRREVDESANRVTESEQLVKALRAGVEAATTRVTELEMEKHDHLNEMGHLLEQVEERTGRDLLKVIGDYHMREQPGEDIRARIEELRQLIDRMGPINLAAIDEFKEQSERHEQLVAQKADLEQALEDLEQAISKMDRDSKRRFKETFEDVNRRFKEIFPRLFQGGSAYLELSDPNDMLKTGVSVIAQPPGKKVRTIESLSGGEKALTAVSLLFAIFLHRPSPFCILDEVDAPLDEANIARFVDMVHEMTDRSQFIIITHSKITMEKSDALFGITMEEPGVSKLVSVRLTNTKRGELPGAGTDAGREAVL